MNTDIRYNWEGHRKFCEEFLASEFCKRVFDPCFKDEAKKAYVFRKLVVGESFDRLSRIYGVEIEKLKEKYYEKYRDLFLGAYQYCNEILQLVDYYKSEIDKLNAVVKEQHDELEMYRINLNEHEIEELNLSIRPYNCLKRARIDTVGQLDSMTAEELQKVKNLGRLSYEEIVEKLKIFKKAYGKRAEIKYVRVLIQEDVAKRFFLKE